MNYWYQQKHNWENHISEPTMNLLWERPGLAHYYVVDLSEFCWCPETESHNNYQSLKKHVFAQSKLKQFIREPDEIIRSWPIPILGDVCMVNEDDNKMTKSLVADSLQAGSKHRCLKDNLSWFEKSGHKILKAYKYEIIDCKKTKTKRSYKCKYPGCTKIFGKTWNFLDHARMHEGIKPFICNVCLKSFTQNGNLQKHIRQHMEPYINDRKTHKCNFCECSYTEKYNLKVRLYAIK
jgi:hypothetical protein